MKLLLTSSGFYNPIIEQKFLELLAKPVTNVKILFIPTASRTKEELEYVNNSKDELVELGIKQKNILIFNPENTPSYDQILDFDVLYVCGGNTFYLTYMMRKSGFDVILKKVVTDGKLYIGVSAGSILVGPDISIASLFDENDIGLTDFTGLGLTQTVPFVHYSVDLDSHVRTIKEKFHTITLTDSQALVINGKNELVIE